MVIMYTGLLLLSLMMRTAMGQEGETKASCDERCDEAYTPGMPCYCNEACIQFENCCFDYLRICNPEAIIPDDWSHFNNHSYRFFEDNTLSSEGAARRCEAEGSLLASINSKEEGEFIAKEVLRMRVMSAFIGGSDKVREGYWRWADGEVMPSPGSGLDQWYEDQPNNGGGEGDEEDCSIITRYRFWTSPRLSLASFYWADYSCESNAKDVQGFICEKSRQCESNPCENNATCRYAPKSGQEQEFACDCNENFYGTRCDMELIPGEKWAYCGETLLEEPSGILTSPLYPMLYPPRVDCTYRIRVSEGHTVALRVHHLDIEDGKNCIFDSLTLYDGGSHQDPQLRPALCGSRTFEKVIYSSTNEVTVKFTTDTSINRPGYRISYTENACSTGTGDSGCGTRKYFTSSCGRIEVTRGVSADSANCEWIIDPPKGMIVNLTLTEFNIPDTGMDCAGGSLAVYDGFDAGSALLGRYCGLQFPRSLQSSSNALYLRLEGAQQWSGDGRHLISMVYDSLDSDNWSRSGSILREVSSSGEISSDQATPHIQTATHLTYTWLLEASIGNRERLDWEVSRGNNASIKIYDGSGADCALLLDVDPSTVIDDQLSGSLLSTTFSLLIVVRKRKDDNQFIFRASYKQEEWDPQLSGCYRPAYQKYSGSPENENTLVTQLEPVVIMVSDQFTDEKTPHYNPGLYCKWRISGEIGSELTVDFLSMNIFPADQDCRSDGIVIYSGGQSTPTKHGPYCGSSNRTVKMTSSTIMVVFYSSTNPRPREGGVFRALVTTSDLSCRKDELGEIKTRTIESSCGILLSPNFPGRVPPEDWSWVIDTPEVAEGAYFNVYLYYVRGPANKGATDCSEFFQLFEVPRDSGSLKHYETSLLKLCQDTDLFIPETTIKLPPYQKLGIDLSTVRSPLPQRWEFKLAYTTDRMPRPPGTMVGNELCPEDDVYYRGSCYRLYPWVLRHYPETREEYSFAKTWQASLDRCEAEKGTLLTIKDEQEAYFIKYTLAHDWFWDKAGTFQTNQRLIFIGLENRAGAYSWTDGSTLAYSDWYWPFPSLYTPLLYPDTATKTADLLHTKIPQPTADSGSLCSVMIPLSPHHSLNWAKVPCDYPFLRTSAICKIPATPSNGTVESRGKEETTSALTLTAPTSFHACPKGWLAAGGTCLSMHTNYALINSSGVKPESPYIPMSYSEARSRCEGSGGDLLTYQPEILPALKDLLTIWNHTMADGDVWLTETEQGCSIIRVDKGHRLDDVTVYTHSYIKCPTGVTTHSIHHVLCQISSLDVQEKCGSDEYRCENMACVSVDSVCDGQDDCGDNSDERNCGCGQEYFRCEDGSKCIPVSLYCDFQSQCPDGSDERNCVAAPCSAHQFRCDNGECIEEVNVCDFRIDCTDGSDEKLETCEGRCRGFQCYSGRCLKDHLRLDLISDCPGLQREDEQGILPYTSVCARVSDNTSNAGGHLANIPGCDDSKNKKEEGSLGLVSDTGVSGNNETGVFGCPQGTAVQCRAGQARCFERANTCIYDTSRMSPNDDRPIMQNCRDGFHLRTNCAGLDCPGMFHCPGSYCIPYNMMCDGRKDCPSGEDEQHCQNFTCPGMLRCKGERYCVPHSKVCDGEVNCHLDGTDEKYCAAKDIACVSECNCTGNVISCTNAGLTSLPETVAYDTRSVRALLLSGNELNLTRETFSRLRWLGRLDLSRNGLKSLKVDLFKDLHNLFDLDLSNNLIETINMETFSGLISLRVLNLHNNLLVRLRVETFSTLVTLEHLIISGNILSDVSEDAFSALTNLREINTDAYKFCCIADHAETCTPAADEFSSCEDLMSNFALQVSIWVLGILAFLGNAFVVLWRLNTDRERVSSFFIINLGFSDLLMGVYLLIIAAVDVFYRGRYIIHADSWKSSALCKVAGVAAMISSEVSVFMLTAITAERFISFVFPLKANSFRLKHARIIAMLGWLMMIILSVIPTLGLPYFGDSFFGRTGVCLPFHLNNERLPGWEYSVFIFLCLNFISFIFIIIGYVAIFLVVSRSARDVQSTSRLDEYSLAKKLALIVGTDLACWVPIVLIGFAALGGASVPPQVAAWIAVFVLPLNSAVNPILYTISALNFEKICCCKDQKNHSVSNGATTVTVAGDSKTRH